MIGLLFAFTALGAPTITLQSLLAEMVDRDRLARFPNPPYESLQASSYNRASVKRGEPGWFADSDGTGYIRKEGDEYVVMERQGPGCITKMWTPFFYYDFNNHVGPNVRIYLDGNTKPVIDESFIKLVQGKGSIPRPFAQPTARAGDCYLPIPFAKSVKVTMTDKPFYNIISYRAYPPGTKVESFVPPKSYDRLKFADKHIYSISSVRSIDGGDPIAAGQFKQIDLPAGSNAISHLGFDIHSLDFRNPFDARGLRPLVLSISFDGEETVWCPLGDFFCSADAFNPLGTMNRGVGTGTIMEADWVMPYHKSATLRIYNFGKEPQRVGVEWKTKKWTWNDSSMHFCARWRPDDVVPGTPFQDWNFVDIHGKGVYVGDAFTVLNIRKDSWWGEGDEKVYVDEAYDKGFPTLFGTGTEDYYGWAGGVLPTLDDHFWHPFLNNVKVGGLDGHTLGYNVLTRERSLDAIPFNSRLRFDMESSFGVDMREKWNLLGYSAVTFFYARPGATHNRPPDPSAAAKPIMNIPELQKMSDAIRGGKG
ncbi:MAG: DUF2961 domain-containing protein [Armatimonadetes bacterium]|nr:DUF2961 domain-containing protein [Armatimonadota bacterium]